MKTFKILFTIVTAFTILTACSNDDDNNNVNPNAEFAGTYNLTSLSAPQEVDYNQDGTASFNLMNETVCYNDSQIVLNEDMTYTAVKSYVFFISETGCQTEDSSGTWEVNGSTLILSDTSMELVATIEYHIEDNMLHRTDPGASYPTRDAEGNPMYTNGDIQYTYTKAN